MRIPFLSKKINPKEIKEDIGPGGWGSVYGLPAPWPLPTYSAYGGIWMPLLFGQDPWSWKSSVLRTLQDHWRVRQFSRMMVETNPYAAGLVRGMTNFICGTQGFNVEIMSKKTGTNKRFTTECQDIIDQFVEYNDIDTAYSEKVYRDFRDGENFIQLYPGENIALRWVEPDMIAIPNGQSTEGQWSMGLKHQGFDYDTIEAICVQYFDASQKIFDFSDFAHSKQNATRNQKRGVSDFLPVMETLQNVYRLNYCWQTSTAVRESMAYIVEASAQQAQIQQLNQTKQQGAVYDWQYLTGTSSQNPVRKVEPGAEVTIPKGYQFKEPPKGTIVPETVIKQALLQVAARFNAPAWLVLGESQEGSYSAAALPESLFIRTVESRQYREAKFWKRVFKRVLEMKLGMGEESNRLDEIDIHLVPPSPVTKNRAEEIKCDLDLVRAEILSQHSFCDKYNMDYDEEKAKIETEEPMPNFNTKTSEESGDNPETSSGEYNKEMKPEKPEDEAI